MTAYNDPGHISLGGSIDPSGEERRESVVTGRAVVSAPDASAVTPAELLPVTADHLSLFQDVTGEDLGAWAAARSLADQVLPQINDWWDRGEYPIELIGRLGESSPA